MIQYNFKNDYSESAHLDILNALVKNNLKQEEGYGDDSFCIEASEIIKQKIGNPKANIHFISGGTQANLVVISSILKPYESVIAAKTAHIEIHETGAIEATGHKINTIETINGKLYIDDIQKVIDFHEDEHYVKPKLVFISNSTEIGTVYSKAELTELSNFCKQKKLILYLDGARLGSALTSQNNDLTIADISNLVDVFYIGGTKNGALLGEAIIINNKEINEHFRFHLKQKGALLAKSRVFGVQFAELFRNDLFFTLGKHANLMASMLFSGIKTMGFEFMTDSKTNQIFPILPNVIIEELGKTYGFYIWEKLNNEKSIIRLVTSWATKQKFVEQFIVDLQKIVNSKFEK